MKMRALQEIHEILKDISTTVPHGIMIFGCMLISEY